MSIPVARIGICTPLGRDLEAFWTRIAAGDDGFIEVDRFALPGLPTRWASAFDGPTTAKLCAEAGHDDPAVAFAILAARDAVAELSAEQRAATALICATSAGAADTHDAYDRARRGKSDLDPELLAGGAFTSFASVIADALGLGGARTTVSTACASGGHALGLAIDLMRSGDAERVLVVGADAVHASLFAGFHSAGALAPRPCSPFGEGFGMSLGEGAGALLLGACEDPVASLLGWSGSCDAYHATAPDPRGEGMARAFRSALVDAQLTPDAVGAFNAHGTGTEANDPAETHAIRAVFGDRIPVSASKSQLGHTQGAAGVLEAIVATLALRHQHLPPTLRSTPARRVAPADPVAGGRARPARYDAVMSHSAAFGGTNVAVIIGRSPRAREPEPKSPVFLAGVGAVGPFEGSVGSALDPAHRPSPSGSPLRVRRADPVTKLLTQAVAHATADADVPRHGAHDGVAMVIGMADGPQDSMRRFVDSRDQRGLGQASAAAFARMVFNAPAGAAAAALGLRGANLTLWSGHGAGAQAVLCGARLLQHHGDVQQVVCAAADEIGYITADRDQLGRLPATPLAAGGALVLSRTPSDVQLKGAAWGPPTQLDAVIAKAIGGLEPDRTVVSSDGAVPATLPGQTQYILDAALGYAPAASGVLASTAAIEWIRAGVSGRVLAVSIAEESGVTALLWASPTLGDDDDRT
ncbi:MAG: beta-ketoacyl-[acyl-carrier-protein] synthase family protein [Proteobacteria bacterium]|nr:beta-ketoacyl-[acyl-carrier-protein] synthase family protein [Pseudomonadota bacterium]